MSEINYYSAAAFTNNVAVARREDVEAAISDLRAALAKADARLSTVSAVRDVLSRAVYKLDSSLQAQLDRCNKLEAERDALKARAERLAEYVVKDDHLSEIVRKYDFDSMAYKLARQARDAARAAVDAHGDLELRDT